MKKFTVHIEDRTDSEPRPHEKKIAYLIAEIFKSDVVFLRRAQSKSPDLYIIRTGVRWEIKSPMGGSKHTIQNNLRAADSQSENVILDLTRSKLTDKQGVSRAKEFIKAERSRIKRIKVLTRGGQIIDIKK